MINFNPKQVVADAMQHGLASMKPKPEGVFGPKQRYHHRPSLPKYSTNPRAYHTAYMKAKRNGELI